MTADGDQRSNLEKLDDLQATRPFSYNLAVGGLGGAIALLLGLDPIPAVGYAISYAALRWFLWQDGRVLRHQYEARAVRWAEKAAERRRQR